MIIGREYTFIGFEYNFWEVYSALKNHKGFIKYQVSEPMFIKNDNLETKEYY